MADTATFRASIPPIMSGIKAGGDGMRVQFDIPESDMGEGVKLLLMRGKVLLVTVETVTIGNDEVKKGPAGGGDRVGDRRLSLRRDK